MQGEFPQKASPSEAGRKMGTPLADDRLMNKKRQRVNVARDVFSRFEPGGPKVVTDAIH